MKPLRAPRLAWRTVDGRAVIVHPLQGEVHELDPVGSYLWTAADGKSSVDQIATRVTVDFEVGFDEALQDARDFFARLADHGLIEMRET